MILADKIIRLRKKNGWSQEELAEKLNVSRQAVSKWEGAQTVPELDKILQLGNLFGVTTDYLLKDEIENEEYTDGISDPGIRKITLAEANEYLDIRKRASIRIAIATILCIISIFPLLLLGTASEDPTFFLSENLACGIGLVAMFPIISVAVILFVRTGFESAPYAFIDKEPFEAEYGVIGLARDAQKKYRRTYTRLNIIGTSICILSPIPLICASFTGKEMLTVIMLTLTMLIAGVGAMFFIVAGVKWASMQKLLKEGEYTPKEKKKSKIRETVGVVYWLFATAIFFIWTFQSDAFSLRYSGLIWLVAGVLFPAVLIICDLITDKNEKDKK